MIGGGEGGFTYALYMTLKGEAKKGVALGEDIF